MNGLVDRLAPLELTPTEASVLVVVGANAGISQSEIGRLLGIASANMAPLIGRLEQRLLIERSPLDGRSFGVQLTRRGEAAATGVRQAMDAQERYLMQQIPSELRVAFKTALQHVLQKLDQ
jgi:DNA-binding MarR family transcriptional regulator